MARFDKGIAWYEIATVTLRVAFPEGNVACRWCPHLRADEACGRHFCRLTGDVLYSPNILGADCPLEFRGETVGTKPKTEE